MRVETAASIFDDDDIRCLCQVHRSYGLNGFVYIVTISCFDKDTGAINWYHGVIPQHFHDFNEDEKAEILRLIMERGGDVWRLHENLDSSVSYLQGLSNDG